MKKIFASTALALTALVALPAFADEHGKGERPSFPMPAAQFKQHVDAKIAKMREHTEKKAASLPADQAKEVRAKLDASIAQMNAEVQKAVADGTVTAEEAKAVRAAGPHRDHGNCDKSKK